jgi:hypothetical protein
LGLVVKEFGPFVEKCSVIFIPFDYEVIPFTKTVALLKVVHQSAHQAAGVQTGHSEKPSQKRGGGRFAVGSRCNYRLRRIQEKMVESLGHGAVVQTIAESGHSFRVVFSGNVAHDNKIRERMEILCPIALYDQNIPGGKKGAHGRVDVLVGAPYVIADLL